VHGLDALPAQIAAEIATMIVAGDLAIEDRLNTQTLAEGSLSHARRCAQPSPSSNRRDSYGSARIAATS
jgi:hypothetical protein